MRTTQTQWWDAMDILEYPMDMAASPYAVMEVGDLSRVMTALAACLRNTIGELLQV